MARLSRLLLWAVGTPVMALLAVISYARSKTGAAAQIGTFVLFIPVIAIVTLGWFVGWSLIIWLATNLPVEISD